MRVGPDPMIRTDLMLVSFGMSGGFQVAKVPASAACARAPMWKTSADRGERGG